MAAIVASTIKDSQLESHCSRSFIVIASKPFDSDHVSDAPTDAASAGKILSLRYEFVDVIDDKETNVSKLLTTD